MGFLIAVLLVPACGGISDLPPSRVDPFEIPAGAQRIETRGAHGGSLHYALQGEPATFNPVMVQDVRSKVVSQLTAGTLLEFDAYNQYVTGGIARSWRVSEDGLTWELQLREGVRFSDGEPVTVDDVLATFDRIYDERSNNQLKNALQVQGHPLQVSRLDSEWIAIRFPAVFAAAETLLATVPVLPRHRMEDESRRVEEFWTLGTAPAEMTGAGPFVLAQHFPGDKTVFRHNPHYWKVDSDGRRLPYLDEVVFHYIENRDHQLLRFQAGELDLVDRRLRPEDLQLLQRDRTGAFIVHSAIPSSELSFFWFNQNTGLNPETGRPILGEPQKTWFTNRAFRQAVSHAISRETMARNVLLGRARPSWSLIPQSIEFWHSKEVRQYEHDPEKARQLLREAGFSWRKDAGDERLIDHAGRAVQFELLTQSEDQLSRMAAIVQEDLRRIGISVSLRQEEFRSVISRIMGSRDYDSAIMKLEFQAEPSDYKHVLVSTGPMHFWNPSQKSPATDWERQIDLLMLRQETTLNREARRRHVLQIQEILSTELPIIPLLNADVLVAHRSGLVNVRPARLFPYALWNIWEIHWASGARH